MGRRWMEVLLSVVRIWYWWTQAMTDNSNSLLTLASTVGTDFAQPHRVIYPVWKSEREVKFDQYSEYQLIMVWISKSECSIRLEHHYDTQKCDFFACPAIPRISLGNTMTALGTSAYTLNVHRRKTIFDSIWCGRPVFVPWVYRSNEASIHQTTTWGRGSGMKGKYSRWLSFCCV